MDSMGLTRVVEIHGANNNAPMFLVEVMQLNKMFTVQGYESPTLLGSEM